jgi:ketosteroid isomerase-like protein
MPEHAAQARLHNFDKGMAVMRRFATQTICVLALAAPLLAQSAGRAAEIGEIRLVLRQQQEAWNRHDLDSFMRGYWKSPELTFVSGANVYRGWQAALDRYRKAYQSEGRDMGKLDFSDLEIEVLSANAAFVRGAFRLQQASGQQPHGRFTLIFRRFSEGWRIVHDHTCAATG